MGATEDERLDGIADSMDMSLSKLQEKVKDREGWCLQSMGLQRVRHNWATAQQKLGSTWGMILIHTPASRLALSSMTDSSHPVLRHHLSPQFAPTRMAVIDGAARNAARDTDARRHRWLGALRVTREARKRPALSLLGWDATRGTVALSWSEKAEPSGWHWLPKHVHYIQRG